MRLNGIWAVRACGSPELRTRRLRAEPVAERGALEAEPRFQAFSLATPAPGALPAPDGGLPALGGSEPPPCTSSQSVSKVMLGTNLGLAPWVWQRNHALRTEPTRRLSIRISRCRYTCDLLHVCPVNRGFAAFLPMVPLSSFLFWAVSEPRTSPHPRAPVLFAKGCFYAGPLRQHSGTPGWRSAVARG